MSVSKRQSRQPNPSQMRWAASVSLDQRLRQEFGARFDRLETYIRAQALVQPIAESRADYDPSNYDPTDRRPVRNCWK